MMTSVLAHGDIGYGEGTPANLTAKCRKAAALYVLARVDTPSPGTGETFSPAEYLIRFGDLGDGKIHVEIVTTRDMHLGPIWTLTLQSAPSGECTVASGEYHGIGS